MEQMINIFLSFGGTEFMKCNYIWLDPYAPDTGRKFIFSGIKSGKNSSKHDDTITVDITVFNKEFGDIFFIQFDIYVLDYSDEDSLDNEWWVYGTVCNIGDMVYRQGEIDVFNIWQKGEIFDWFSLPFNSHLKSDYIRSCLKHTGLTKKMLDKERYRFDVSLVKEEIDFCYLASLEFVGDRGYFGHDFHTFEDCLLEMYNYNGYFYGTRIVFLNADKIYSIEIALLLEEVKKLFLMYEFFIETIDE